MQCNNSRAMKMNILMLPTTTQMNLTSTMLRERSQTEKGECSMILFVWISKTGNLSCAVRSQEKDWCWGDRSMRGARGTFRGWVKFCILTRHWLLDCVPFVKCHWSIPYLRALPHMYITMQSRVSFLKGRVFGIREIWAYTWNLPVGK